MYIHFLYFYTNSNVICIMYNTKYVACILYIHTYIYVYICLPTGGQRLVNNAASGGLWGMGGGRLFTIYRILPFGF